MNYAYGSPEWKAVQAEYEQLSAAEVPGFHARTVIDDAIGKLFAVRSQLRVEIPEAVPALLDHLEEITDRLADEAFDPDAEEVESYVTAEVELPEDVRRYGGGCLRVSGSDTFHFCSCGTPGVSAASPRKDPNDER